jgi:hypothetical protein
MKEIKKRTENYVRGNNYRTRENIEDVITKDEQPIWKHQ